MSGEGLRIGVVGLGKMGLLHASILNTMPNIEVTALCDKSALIRKFCDRVFDGVHVEEDLSKLVDLDLNAVYVCTPIFSHFPVTKAIYSNGIAHNVFVEKTLASSCDEAQELCELARNFGGANMVGYMKRFAVTFRRAKHLLNQGALGELSSFQAYAYSSDFLGTKKKSRNPTFRGGILRDLGCHIMDLALWFFGDLQVESAKPRSPSEGGGECSASFSVEKSDGLEGRFDISWCMEAYRLPEWGLLIRGSDGTMRVNDDKVELELEDGKSGWHRHDLSDNVGFLLGEPEYYREDECFIKSVLESSSADPSFSTASKVDCIIDQVEKRAGKND